TARFASRPAGLWPARYGGRGWSSLMATITGSGPATGAPFWRRYVPSCAASKRADDRPTRSFAQRPRTEAVEAALITRARSVLEARVAKDSSDGRVGFERATGEHLGGGTDVRSCSETYV